MTPHDWFLADVDTPALHAIYPKVNGASEWHETPSEKHRTLCGMQLVLRQPDPNTQRGVARCDGCCASAARAPGYGIPRW